MIARADSTGVTAALAALTVEDANALLQTALREENRAYVQIDPAEK